MQAAMSVMQAAMFRHLELTLRPPATELTSTPVRRGHLECVQKLRPRCRSSSSRGSSLPCRQGGRRRRPHSASSSKRAPYRRLGGASACCKARRTARVRRHRQSAPARTTFEAPLRTPRTHLSASCLCSIRHCSGSSASETQCSPLSAISRGIPFSRSTANSFQAEKPSFPGLFC